MSKRKLTRAFIDEQRERYLQRRSNRSQRQTEIIKNRWKKEDAKRGF